jgi:cell wall-associated NlpC family hydrolase
MASIRALPALLVVALTPAVGAAQMRPPVHATVQPASMTTGMATASVVAVRGSVDGQAIIATARHYLGVRYLMGGTTPRAFDCSGFIRYVFARHGIALPRTAHEQAAIGEAPAVGDSLLPGDLLFFYGGQGAQHIAMYVGGDTIIHASSTRHHVRLDVLTRAGSRRTWFNERLIAVRRVLPLDGFVYVPARAGEPTMSLLPAGARVF